MSRMNARTRERLAALRHYLDERRKEVRADGNTGRGLSAWIETLDGILRAHAREGA